LNLLKGNANNDPNLFLGRNSIRLEDAMSGQNNGARDANFDRQKMRCDFQGGSHDHSHAHRWTGYRLGDVCRLFDSNTHFHRPCCIQSWGNDWRHRRPCISSLVYRKNLDDRGATIFAHRSAVPATFWIGLIGVWTRTNKQFSSCSQCAVAWDRRLPHGLVG